MLLKSANTLRKKVLRDICDNLSDFSCSSDEEWIQAIKLMLLGKTIFEDVLLKEQFQRVQGRVLFI